MAVTMATSHLMTGRFILIFGLNSSIFILSFGEIVANILLLVIFLNIFDQLWQISTNIGYLIGTVCG